MSEAKHTPGPWSAELFDNGGAEITAADRFPICITSRQLSHANARLIAAAPDLLRELRHLVALLEPMEVSGHINVPGLATLNGARAAIAKALGGAV